MRDSHGKELPISDYGKAVRRLLEKAGKAAAGETPKKGDKARKKRRKSKGDQL